MSGEGATAERKSGQQSAAKGRRSLTRARSLRLDGKHVNDITAGKMSQHHRVWQKRGEADILGHGVADSLQGLPFPPYRLRIRLVDGTLDTATSRSVVESIRVVVEKAGCLTVLCSKGELRSASGEGGDGHLEVSSSYLMGVASSQAEARGASAHVGMRGFLTLG